MALSTTNRGASSTNLGSQSTLVVTPASNLAAGSVAVLCCAYDNSGTNGADPFSAISDSVGNFWHSGVNALNDPGAASAGVAIRIFWARLKFPLTTSNTITVSFGGITTVARAWTLTEVTAAAGSAAIPNSGSASATGSSTTPSVNLTNGSTGDLHVGMFGAEGNAAVTADSDSTGGTWSTQQTSGIGTTTSGIEIASQCKVQTSSVAGSAYNTAITTGDWAAAVLRFGELADTLATPGVKTLTLATFAPTIQLNKIATPGVKALTLSSFAPAVTATANRLCTPGLVTLTLTKFAPTVSTPRLCTPGLKTLTLTPLAPTASAPRLCTPGVKALTLTKFAPTASAPCLCTPGLKTLALAPFAPVTHVDFVGTPGTKALTLSSFAPAVSTPRLCTPGVKTLTLTAFVPQIVNPCLCTPGTRTLLLLGFAPTIPSYSSWSRTCVMQQLLLRSY